MEFHKSNSIYYYQNTNKYFVLNPQTKNWIIGTNLNQITETLSQKINKKETNDEDLINIVLHITNICNLNCAYCYVDQQSEKRNISDEIILMLINTLNQSNFRKVNFFFHGGEPLIHYEKLKKYTQLFKLKLEKSYKIHVQTNGTLINQEMVDFFKEMDFSISISIDGYESYHNSNRKFKNRKNSFQNVMQKFDLLRKNELPVATNSVFTSAVDPEKLFHFFKSNSITGIKLNPVINSGNAIKCLDDSKKDIDLIIKNYLTFIDLLVENNLKNTQKFHEANLRSFLYKLSGVSSPFICNNSPCGMGNTMFMINENGDFYPCEQLYDLEQFKIDNISNIPSLNILRIKSSSIINSFQLKQNEYCYNCPYLYFCGGLCMKRLFINDISLCKFRKNTIDYFLSIILNYSDKPHILKELI